MPLTRRELIQLGVGSVLIVGGGAITANAFREGEAPAPVPTTTWSKAPGDVTPQAATRIDPTDPSKVLVTDEAGKTRTIDVGTGPFLAIPGLDIVSKLVPTQLEPDPNRDNTERLHLPPADQVALGPAASVKDRIGSVLVAGHVSYEGERGALYHLADIAPGTCWVVRDPDGNAATFMATGIEVLIKKHLPEKVWRTDGPRFGYLITCGGKLLRTDHGLTYESNTIVEGVQIG